MCTIPGKWAAPSNDLELKFLFSVVVVIVSLVVVVVGAPGARTLLLRWVRGFILVVVVPLEGAFSRRVRAIEVAVVAVRKMGCCRVGWGRVSYYCQN